MEVGNILVVLADVTRVLNAGSRWRVAEISEGTALLHRIGQRGQRLTSKWTVNEHRAGVADLAWMLDGSHAKLVKT